MLMICVILYFIIVTILIYLMNSAFKTLMKIKRKQNFIRQKFDKVNVFKSFDTTFRQF